MNAGQSCGVAWRRSLNRFAGFVFLKKVEGRHKRAGNFMLTALYLRTQI